MKYRYLLPSIFWFLIILWIISIPGGSIPKSSLLKIPHIDKVIHAVVFAVFTFLLSYGFLMQKKVLLGRYPYTFSFLIGVLYSIITEWIQLRFVIARSGELLDLLADMTGCLAGIVLFDYLKRFIPTFLQK